MVILIAKILFKEVKAKNKLDKIGCCQDKLKKLNLYKKFILFIIKV